MSELGIVFAILVIPFAADALMRETLAILTDYEPPFPLSGLFAMSFVCAAIVCGALGA